MLEFLLFHFTGWILSVILLSFAARYGDSSFSEEDIFFLVLIMLVWEIVLPLFLLSFIAVSISGAKK